MRRAFHLLVPAAVALAAAAAAEPPVAVEYVHGATGHYRIAATDAEQAALDARAPGGWTRTGLAFAVLPAGTPGSADVCRYARAAASGVDAARFHTAFADECAALRRDPAWREEDVAFAVRLPDAAGRCADGDVALLRAFNDYRGGAPNHRLTVDATVHAGMVARGWIAEGPGAGVAACVPARAETGVRGRVAEGAIAGALVCADASGNGRCDAGEPQALTDADGVYALAVPAGTRARLVAEVVAGRARDATRPQGAVAASYRMAAPRGYSSDITAFTTLVALAHLDDDALAEDVVRATLGLPPRFDLRPASTAPGASLRTALAARVVAALQAGDAKVDHGAPDALARIAAHLPSEVAALPTLAIDTGGLPIASKEDYVDAGFVLTHGAAAVPAHALRGKIRGRGNSTWGQPKNPYKLQFANDAAYAALDDVAGLTRQRNWVLLADWFDRSLVRNKLALSLAAGSVFADGLRWSPSGQHVEVWLNGDYAGVYLLAEDIRIDAARLPLAKMSADPARGETGGGYILEVDMRLDCWRGPGPDLGFVTPAGVPVCVDTPDEDAITPAQLDRAKALVVEAEREIAAHGALDRIHAPSFADWYLVEELFRTHDAMFMTSDFLWKDADHAASPHDRRLNMGPVWDFDRSAGNLDYDDGWNPQGCWVAKGYRPNWIAELAANPAFVRMVVERWQRKRPALAAFVDRGLDAFAARLAPAAGRNFARWPILGLPLGSYAAFATHAEEVAFVRAFLRDRIAWLDRAYASPEAFAELCR